MKNWFLILVSIGLITACSTLEGTEPNAAAENVGSATAEYSSETRFEPGKGVMIAAAIKLTATVLSVDKEDRSIVIRAADGEARKIELTDDVKNFDQIRTGDEVVIEVYSALVMQLAEPGEGFSDTASGLVAIAQPGEKPRMVVADVVEVLAEITEIDRTRRELTVTGPLGNSVTLQVPETMTKFDELRVGDKVNARYVEAFALSVQSAN